MASVLNVEKLLSVLPRKRFGKYNQLGMVNLGFSDLGDSDIYFIRKPLGICTLGNCELGDSILFSGFFRSRMFKYKRSYERLRYYIPKNPRYIPQQANRQKMADAVAAWQALTSEQKALYNKNAIGKRFSGYNLFIREHLLS